MTAPSLVPRATRFPPLRAMGLCAGLLVGACASSNHDDAAKDAGAGGDGSTGPGVDSSLPQEGGGPSDGGSGCDGGQGCDSGAPISQDFTGGTRIKVKWLTTADGTQQFWGWFDTKLSAQCSHQTAADGQLRCLPISYGAAFVSGSDFADSQCTQPVATFQAAGAPGPDDACTANGYASSTETSGCGYRFHVYPLGASVPTDHYSGSPTSCQKTTGDSALSYYALGAELPATDFVSTTLTNGAANGGIVPVFEQSDDGSQGLYELDEATTKTPCVFQSDLQGQTRCFPSRGAFSSGLFSDDKCSSALFAYPSSAPGCSDAGPSDGYTQSLYVSCSMPSGVETFSLGAELGDASVYSAHTAADGGILSCNRASISAGEVLYKAGASLPTTTFGSVSVSAPRGSTRLQEVDYVSGGGLTFEESFPTPSSLYDSQRKETCVFAVAADGQTRCLPSANVLNLVGVPPQFFSDSACTQPVVEAPTLTCSAPPPEYIETVDATSCPAKTHVLSIGSLVTGHVYASTGSASAKECTPIAPARPAPRFYSYGSEIAASAFEPATMQLE